MPNLSSMTSLQHYIAREPHPNPTWVFYGADLGKGAGSPECRKGHGDFVLLCILQPDLSTDIWCISNFNSKLLDYFVWYHRVFKTIDNFTIKLRIDNKLLERSGFTYTSGRGHNPFDHEIFIGSHQFLVKAGAMRRSQEVSSSRM